MNWNGKNKSAMIVLLVFGIGVFLRIYDLDTESFSLDEVLSVRFAQGDLSSITNLPISEVHPPLYHILLHFWVSFFGTSEFAVRFLSAIFGMLSVLILFKLGKTLFNFEKGVYSALILAISTFHIKFSQEARMYSLLTLMTLLSIFFFIKLLKENQLKFWVGYVAGSTLMLYSNFYGVFILVLEILLFLLFWKRNRKVVKRYILAQLAIFLFLLPGLFRLLEVISYISRGHSSIAWIPATNFFSLAWTFLVFSNGSVIGLLLFAALSLAGIMDNSERTNQLKLNAFFKSLKGLHPSFFPKASFEVFFCVLWIMFPIIASFLISWILQPIYLPKYLIMVSPALYLLVAKGLPNKKKKVRNLIILIILLDSVFMVTTYHYGTIENEQWREAAQYIEENANPNELILINAPWYKVPFNHYFKGSNEVKGVKTVDLLKEVLTSHRHLNVWLILSADELTDPEGLIKQELDETYVLTREKEYHMIKIYYYVTIK